MIRYFIIMLINLLSLAPALAQSYAHPLPINQSAWQLKWLNTKTAKMVISVDSIFFSQPKQKAND